MTETLLKVCVKGQENNGKDMSRTGATEGDSGEGMMKQTKVPQENGLDTPTMASKNKGLWHRIKRASKGEAGSGSLATAIGGKRNISDVVIEDARATKKLKQ